VVVLELENQALLSSPKWKAVMSLSHDRVFALSVTCPLLYGAQAGHSTLFFSKSENGIIQ
jgi:hypothetical protein